MKLHPNWPEFQHQEFRWDQPDPIGDLTYALDIASGGVVHLLDLATVEAYSIVSDAGSWTREGDSTATELNMVIVGTLQDGRWFALEAWNDYTGWGCQDGSDIYLAATRQEVEALGLTNSGRLTLGLPQITAPS